MNSREQDLCVEVRGRLKCLIVDIKKHPTLTVSQFTIADASLVLNSQYVWELKKKGADSVLLSKIKHKNMLISALKNYAQFSWNHNFEK